MSSPTSIIDDESPETTLWKLFHLRSSDHQPVYYTTFHVDVNIDSRAFSSKSQTLP